MAGPFPGVDPYLENLLYWRGFHTGFITFMTAALNTVLPMGFAANYEERVYVIPSERSIYPDLMVLHRPILPTAAQTGATAVVEPGAPHGILTAYPEEIHEGFIQVRSADNWEQVVAIIEVLSPANKAVGSVGREEYLQKQGEILRSEAHLLEIDLLSKGMHTVAAPLEGLRQKGEWDGLICLHRSDRRYHYEYWFNRLREPLPPILVPLTGGLPGVLLDLQEAYNQAYDVGPYRRRIDYLQEPLVPLNADDTAWADTLLKEKGLHPSDTPT
ncbi:MAG TPA: DUF4058 family protein [Chthonomonadaceae bacterium]|nr:DUF4058 family protein [Chthonomonadaceae bacterium]